MPKLKCLKCKYEWSKRTITIPKECPRCKRYDWNKKDIKVAIPSTPLKII